MEKLSANDWIDRCATRIVEVDRDIAAHEARDLARHIRAFERTAAMAPEAAVDFVAAQLAQPSGTRFERRATPRH